MSYNKMFKKWSRGKYVKYPKTGCTYDITKNYTQKVSISYYCDKCTCQISLNEYHTNEGLCNYCADELKKLTN